MKQYIAKSGDTVGRVCERRAWSGVTAQEVMELNHLRSTFLTEGHTLYLPEQSGETHPEHYNVCYGDTLWKIAEKYLGSAYRWREIEKLNRLHNPHRLFIGQPLLLPTDSTWPLPAKVVAYEPPINPERETIREDQHPAIHIPSCTLIRPMKGKNHPAEPKKTSLEGKFSHLDHDLKGFAHLTLEGTMDASEKLIEGEIKNWTAVKDELIPKWFFMKGARDSMTRAVDDEIEQLEKAGKAIKGLGYVVSAFEIGESVEESWKKRSIKPLEHEVIKQVESIGIHQVVDFAGDQLLHFCRNFAIGAAEGAAVGVETGPGDIVVAFVGGMVVGILGDKAADWTTEHVNHFFASHFKHDNAALVRKRQEAIASAQAEPTGVS